MMRSKRPVLDLLASSLLAVTMVVTAQAESFDTTNATVSRIDADRILTPVNQLVMPAGRLVSLPGMRPQALALSPNGKMLVAAGAAGHELIVLDPVTGQILQRVAMPPGGALPHAGDGGADGRPEPDKRAEISFAGLVFSPDGTRVYLSNVAGDIKVFSIAKDGKLSPLGAIPLPESTAPDRKEEIPTGLAVSSGGDRLYVALNLSNKLAEIDTQTSKVVRTWDVGVAPYDVVLVGDKAYVSNWGGRRPDAGSLTGPAGRGTRVRVDPVRHIAAEGSLSVIDLRKADAPRDILVGLHSCALALSPNRRYLVVANAGIDTLSVIDMRTDEVVETICTRQDPGDLFGAQPNALAFDRSGKRLYACNGTQNAVAVFRFHPGKSQLCGLIPVGWFPGAVIHDAKRRTLYVANLKDLGPGRPGKSGVQEYNSRDFAGSLSQVSVPSKRALTSMTKTALTNMRYPLLAQAALPPRPDQPARPVPERVGEPSVFKHVVYVIKENRAYDQVLGDVKEGDGDPDLCIFGERVTPNQHKLVHEFALLDNTYCSGVCSADGHQWSDSAMATDYVERSVPVFPRSYMNLKTAGALDALAYSPAGFLWDDALSRGKSVLDFGECTVSHSEWKDPAQKKRPDFLDIYRSITEGRDDIKFWSEPGIESLRPYTVSTTVGWDLNVPDIWRARRFAEELKKFEQQGGFPDLTIMVLPNDHTSGTRPGAPTPAAQVADNDLAVGRLIESISHSKFWADTCVFIIEDDPQNGWDHVSGYRTTAYVISPYTKRGKVISTQYNQTSLLRTMELILGLPPMNQLDATATPMFDCFTATPDLTPFDSVPNIIPLDQMNEEPKKISDARLREDALRSARLPLDQPDRCPDDVLNRILWRSAKGTSVPYPEWAVKCVEDDD